MKEMNNMFSLKQLICHHIYKLYKCKKCGKLHERYVGTTCRQPDDVISKQQMYDNLNNECMLKSMEMKN